jgi:hypothetical protein
VKQADALELVAVIQAAYPRQPWPNETVALFADELQRLPVERALAAGAIRRMLRERTSEFAPSLAEILRAIAADADAPPAFDAAWSEMGAAASSSNYFRPDEPPGFSHPAIARLASAIGWHTFRMSSMDDHWFRRNAEQLYGQIIEDRVGLLLDHPEALVKSERRELPNEMRALVSGIGDE